MQSIRSIKPPWPGRVVAKSLIPMARLKPEAKKPRKGDTNETYIAIATVYTTAGASDTEKPPGKCQSTLWYIGSISWHVQSSKGLKLKCPGAHCQKSPTRMQEAMKPVCITLETAPPRNPSSDLLGLSPIRLCHPKSLPAKKAQASFRATDRTEK